MASGIACQCSAGENLHLRRGRTASFIGAAMQSYTGINRRSSEHVSYHKVREVKTKTFGFSSLGGSVVQELHERSCVGGGGGYMGLASAVRVRHEKQLA